MIGKIKSVFYLLFVSLFITFIIIYYFSDKNINEIAKSKLFYKDKHNNDFVNLPLIKSDTNNIIEYTDDIENFKKKKKRYLFWKLIGK